MKVGLKSKLLFNKKSIKNHIPLRDLNKLMILVLLIIIKIMRISKSSPLIIKVVDHKLN